jgi:hypothetical protein
MTGEVGVHVSTVEKPDPEHRTRKKGGRRSVVHFVLKQDGYDSEHSFRVRYFSACCMGNGSNSDRVTVTRYWPRGLPLHGKRWNSKTNGSTRFMKLR